jgi:hypothetical protein
VPVCAALVGINAIDFDHVVYGHLDDGTANSLTLHPLHIHAGVLIFLLAVYAAVNPGKARLCLALMGGISLHLAADSLAFAVNYQIPILIAIDCFVLPFFILSAERLLRTGPKRAFQVFVVSCYLLCTIEQAFLRFVLNLDTTQHPIISYGNGGLLPALSALFLYAFFSAKKVETHEPAAVPAL